MDDEDLIRGHLSLMLADVGYDAVTAANGCEALEAVQKAVAANRPFACVILGIFFNINSMNSPFPASMKAAGFRWDQKPHPVGVIMETGDSRGSYSFWL